MNRASERAAPVVGAFAFLWLFALAVGVVALGLCRGAFLAVYGPGWDKLPGAELLRCLEVGTRLDAKVTAVALLPAALFLLLSFPLASRVRWVLRGAIPFLTFALFVLALLGGVNHFYFRAFNSPIDMRAFGLVHDGFLEVMASVWADYPVVWGAGILLVFVAGLAWMLRTVFTWALFRLRLISFRIALPLFLGAVLILAACARGSLTTFPLERDSLSVSRLPFLNAAANNGPFALLLAMEDNGKLQVTPTSPEEGAAIARRAGLSVSGDFSLDSLMRSVPARANFRSPHVVVVLSESLSGELLLNPQSRGAVVGNLSARLPELMWFSRFVSALDGTFPSLEFLLFHSFGIHVSDSAAQFRPLSTSFTAPFRQAGYRTAFVTSGSAGWRNLVQALPRQGFDVVVDQATIRDEFPSARGGTWGVFDQWMFASIEHLLEKADAEGVPLLVFALTTSNHSPFLFPENWKAPSVGIPPFLTERLLVSPDRMETLLLGQRRAHEDLAQFLEGLERRPWSDHTVVAVTGDHGLREGIDYGDIRHVPLQHAVPFLLRVPQRYRDGLRFDPLRPGSHKDILPTLAQIALPGGRFFSLGHNLLSAAEEGFMAENQAVVFDRKGAVIGQGGAPRCFVWESYETLTLGNEDAGLCAAMGPAWERAEARKELVNWQIRIQQGLER